MIVARRLLLVLLALFAAVPALAAPDWLHTYAVTAEGGYRVGNPQAKVKLVEYGSFSCPHCRHWRAESLAPLEKKYIAPGLISLEFRPYILNSADFVATMLARCDDPRAFFQRMAAYYDQQDQWLQPFIDLTDADQARVRAAPEGQRVLVLGQSARLDRFMTAHGMTPARVAQCLTAKPLMDQVEARQNEAIRAHVDQTPTFLVNGVKDDGSPVWAEMDKRLAEALRKPGR